MATIRVSDESMGRLEPNIRPGEDMDQMINRVLDLAEDENLSEQDVLDAEEAKKEFEEGRCVPHEKVKQRYGL